MTGLSHLKRTGSGTLAFRVEFAGLDTVFCTHPGMKGPEFDGSPNLLPAAGAVTWGTASGTIVVTPGQTDPDGGTAATLLNETDPAGEQASASTAGAHVSGTPVRVQIRIKRDGAAPNTVGVETRAGGTGSTFVLGGVIVHLGTGQIATYGTGYSDPECVEDVPGWWRVRFTQSGAGLVGGTLGVRVRPAIGLASAFPARSSGATGSCTVYAPSIVSSYGRERAGGLKLDGFKTIERARLTHSTIEAKGATIKIADVGERATLALAAEPEHTTWLTATVSDTATTIPVASTEGWPDAGVLHIDTEAIAYAGKTPTSFTGCTRGIWRTVAQHHYVGTGGALRYPEVTSRVTVLEGRRVRLHVYELGDSKRGNGTQRWLGVVSGSPRMTGPQWSIMCDSIARVLDAELGVGLDEPISVRGIYYNAANPWTLHLHRRIGDNLTNYYHGLDGEAGGLNWLRPGPFDTWTPESKIIRFPNANTSDGDGYFGSQEEFLAAVQARIDAETVGWKTSVFIEPFGASYRFRLRSDAGAPEGVMLRLESRVDGALERGIHTGTDGPVWFAATGVMPFAGQIDPDTDYYTYLIGGRELGEQIPNAGEVPRGIHGAVSPGDAWGELSAGSPAYRLHLGGTVAAPPVGSAVLIEWPDDDSEVTYEVRARNGGERHIELNRPAGLVDRGWHRYTPGLMPTIRFGRTYGATDAISSLGTYTLMRALTDEAPEQVNLGAQPMIESGDWNASEWEAAYLGASPLAAQRRYSTFEPIRLGDFISPDAQLASHFLAFDEAGRLTVRRLRLASQTEAATFALTKGTLAAWPTYERSPMGQINTLALVAGYDARAGEAVGQPYTARDVGSYGRAPGAKILKIEPKSAYIGPAIAPDDVMEVAQTVLGIFSGPYAYVTCETTLQALDVTLGSTVSITTKHLPNGEGRRGMNGQVGLVIAREVDWYGAKIELTVLVDARRIAGYAPSALITAQTHVSGNTWDLELDPRTLAAGEQFAGHFEPGDAIDIEEFDASAPAGAFGFVESVSGTTVRATFPVGWTPGASRWLVRSAVSPDLSASSRQARYAFVADLDLRIWFSDGSQPARQFAP